jgi:transposase
MDAVHPTQATKVTSGWIRTGTDKPIETTGSRTRLNIVGAIQLGQLSKTVAYEYDKVNAETMITFIESLCWKSNTRGVIHLVLDGAGYHRAAKFKNRATELGIQLHYLPPYSPNLNPIERLWKVMNEKVRNNQFFHNAKEFRQQINLFFKEILPEIGGSLNTRINDNFQVFDQTFSS